MKDLLDISLTANQLEGGLVDSIISKVHKTIISNDNVPNAAIKFLKMIKNIADGEVKKPRLKQTFNSEKLTLLAFKKLFEIGYIKNDLYRFTIKQGTITTIEGIDKLGDLIVDSSQYKGPVKQKLSLTVGQIETTGHNIT